MTQIIQFKRGTAATAATDNPVLAVGEPAVETDTGIFKIGDGASTWSALPVVYTRKVVANASATNLAITNLLHVFTGTATVNWTLPVIGSTPIGSLIRVKNRGTAPLVIVPTGTDHIFDLASLSTFVIQPGESAMFSNDGSYWVSLMSQATGSVINVKAFGARGDGSTDDTAAIQAAINASAPGATVLFPVGTYLVSAVIPLLPSRRYTSNGHAHADTAVIKQKNGANITNAASLTGLLVAQAWTTNATACDLPIRIDNITVDGNKANNSTSTACGIVLTNYRSWVTDCDILNTPKDGVRFTDTTANGTNVVTNSCVENRVLNCHIDSCGGDGVRNVSGNGNSNTDGYLNDCIISNTTGSGINLDRSAGWHIRGNHLYGIGVHGINANGAFATSINDNYVEDFGNQATAAAFYAGIQLNQLTGRQSSIINNYIGCLEPSAGVGAYQYLNASSAFGSTDSHIVVTGNKLHAPAAPTNKGIGFVLSSNGGGSTSIIYLDNNDVVGVNTAQFNDGSATVRQGLDTVTTATVLNKTVAATGNKVAGGLAVLTSEFSLSNSTTETTILQATLPTGDLVVGSTYRIRVHSTVVNLLASNNYVLKVYLGGVAATAAFTWAGAVTAGAFWNEFLVTVRSVGSSGTFMCNGSGGGTAQGSTAVTATNTVDTTQASPILKVTATFSAASASNNVKVENAIIERVM